MTDSKDYDHLRKFTLDQAAKAVLNDRNATYGAPEDVFSEIAEAWQAVFGYEFTAVDVALALVMLKVVRAKHNPRHIDSWIDMAGYAACGAEVAAKTYPEEEAVFIPPVHNSQPL